MRVALAGGVFLVGSFFLAASGVMETMGTYFAGELDDGLYARVETNRGGMTFWLDYEGVPLTVTNFVLLAEGVVPGKGPLFAGGGDETGTGTGEGVGDAAMAGEPYFDGLTFYRKIQDYAVFSGDPDGTGYGGSEHSFPRELGGTVSTAEAGTLVMDGFPGESAGSRFFILDRGDPFLDAKYTAFGVLVRGRVVLDALKAGDVIESVRLVRQGDAAMGFVADLKGYESLLEEARALELERLERENPLVADAIRGLGEAGGETTDGADGGDADVDAEGAGDKAVLETAGSGGEIFKTLTGIFYTVVNEGEGETPGSGDEVSVQYTGTLVDGTVFDSSRTRDQPFTFTLGTDGIIPGWIEMLTTMKRGETRRVVIPPYLAYGENGSGPIPPGSWLVFDIELINFTEG